MGFGEEAHSENAGNSDMYSVLRPTESWVKGTSCPHLPVPFVWAFESVTLTDLFGKFSRCIEKVARKLYFVESRADVKAVHSA